MKTRQITTKKKSTLKTVKLVKNVFDRILHPELARDWDNVGLLVGDPDQRVSRILLCIDLTAAVLREAQARRVQMILAYHPPIFTALKNIRADRQEIIFQAIRANIAVYAIHTALDVLPGGTSDVLADLIDLRDRRPIEAVDLPSNQSKVVIFVPAQAEVLSKVSQALFRVGAGVIGQYAGCSFLTPGHGTFIGSEESHPAVGRAGNFETVEEMRLEVIAENDKLPAVVRAIRENHPYEEPAFDVYPLKAVSELGIGRVGVLATPTTLKKVVDQIKKRTRLHHLQIADAANGQLIRAAVGPGSCGKMLDVLEGKIDLFVTGEVRHHDALSATRSGISIICLGHGNSERITLNTLQKILARSLPDVEFFTSARDVDPLAIV